MYVHACIYTNLEDKQKLLFEPMVDEEILYDKLKRKSLLKIYPEPTGALKC